MIKYDIEYCEICTDLLTYNTDGAATVGKCVVSVCAIMLLKSILNLDKK